jgi:hypothetical protein
LPYQIYKRKIEGSLTSAMIKKACRPPSENIGAIFSEGIEAMGITAREPPEPFEQYEVKVDPKILSIPARAIAQPTLDFASGQPGEVIKKYKDERMSSRITLCEASGNSQPTTNSLTAIERHLDGHSSWFRASSNTPQCQAS